MAGLTGYLPWRSKNWEVRTRTRMLRLDRASFLVLACHNRDTPGGLTGCARLRRDVEFKFPLSEVLYYLSTLGIRFAYCYCIYLDVVGSAEGEVRSGYYILFAERGV